MAHLGHNSKRRRLDQATSALSRPFKSPLRTPLQKTDDPVSPSSLRHTVQTKAIDGSSARNDGEISAHQKDPDGDADPTIQSPKPPTTITTSSAQVYKTPLSTVRKRKSFSSPSTSLLTSDPVISALQKQHTALQSRLSALRAELDTTQQALRIESSTKDEELEALISKWKAASQDAAEEVFAGARDRVFRMGGIRAWREQARRGRERWDDGEQEGSGCRQGVDEDELERRKAEALDAVEVEGMEKADQEEEGDDESFTMDMMLKSLNIELDAIGFDKANQRWIKD